MQILEKSKKEIENKAGTMSDFLRMEYLELCLKKFFDMEIQRYCFEELAKLYEKKHMYSEALKYTTKFKGICIMQREKIECTKKEIELLIKSGAYEKADSSFREAMKELNQNDRFELRRRIIEMYYEEAKNFEIANKNSSLIKIYHSLLNYVTDHEKNEVKRKMVESYKRLGKVKESLFLERELNRETGGDGIEMA